MASIGATALRGQRVFAGDGLLHPVAIGAIALLVLNDHVLKAAFPGFVTGKLSDLAGLIFFPLFLQAAWEVGQSIRGTASSSSRSALTYSVLLTGLAFAVIKIHPGAADLAGAIFGWLQWLIALAPAHGPWSTHIVTDWTDLIALPALLIPWLIGSGRGERFSFG
jgi:hypothetical protein